LYYTNVSPSFPSFSRTRLTSTPELVIIRVLTPKTYLTRKPSTIIPHSYYRIALALSSCLIVHTSSITAARCSLNCLKRIRIEVDNIHTKLMQNSLTTCPKIPPQLNLKLPPGT